MKVKEVIRWGLVLLSAGIAVLIISLGGSEVIRAVVNQCWTDASVALFLTALFAAFPVIYAILAFRRRWRDLLVLPVLSAAVALWSFLFSLPQKLGLYHLHGTPRVELHRLLLGDLLIVVLFIGSFFAAKWFVRVAFNLLGRVVPPNGA